MEPVMTGELAPEELDARIWAAQGTYPATPFEKIGFSLSGGGFRAACYGLGVLSLMQQVKVEDGTLLEKVRFVSSASGGTITLSAYVASLHGEVAFPDFYRHLMDQMTGERLLDVAISILNDENSWTEGGKSRNIINAFALAYEQTIFTNVPDACRTVGGIAANTGAPVHVEEFCFNATEFYSGISFRFQDGPKGRGVFGGSNIRINGKEAGARDTLRKIRLADVLAASSCFPLGFEPIVYPVDFSRPGGPGVAELRAALRMKQNTWDDNGAVQNTESKRAKAEHAFVTKGNFGLMDGGICDNQGLYSLLLANERGRPAGTDSSTYNRFDLMMVSDVTSFYMKPYDPPALNTKASWMKKTLAEYWNEVRAVYGKVDLWISRISLWSIVIAVLFALPLVLEGVSVAAVALLLEGVALVFGGQWLHTKYKKFKSSNPLVNATFQRKEPADLVNLFMTEDSFARRTAGKVVGYLQSSPVGVLAQMVNARLQSTITMVSEVFLKHVRRLIYEMLFDNPRFEYRQLDNMIYKLAYTNNKNRRQPRFEARKDTDGLAYDERLAAFKKDVSEKCLITPAMQKIAEQAYTVGTTLWFDNEQEGTVGNSRMALVATGQFTTCYNLLAYALGLRHSRNFATLDAKYQTRLISIVDQLSALMIAFKDDPYYLVRKMSGDAMAV